MSLSQDQRVDQYKPGSIRRVKMQNFLTYADVEFHPGPRLNMVVGPNGTGKSTILCAICLGLGGEPKLLGRADDLRRFIMHEKDQAMIEIELAPHDPLAGNPEIHVFRRVIDRNKGSDKGKGRGASTFFINDAKSSIKEIQKIVSDIYHISVDNLCTFLPQDRVGNFSGFDAQSLLIETEKSLSGSKHLYETHMKLIEAQEELRKGGNQKETIEEKLKSLEAENQRLEREKERMEEREEAIEQMQLLEKKMLWLQFDVARSRARALKVEKIKIRDEVKKAQETLEPLHERQAALASKKERMDAKFRTLDVAAKKSDREMEKHKSKAENHFDEIEDVMSTLNSIDSDQRLAERLVESQKKKVEQLEAQQQDLPSKEELDSALSEAQQELRSIKPELTQARNEVNRLHHQWKDHEEQAKNSQAKLAKLNDEHAQRKARVFRQQPKLHDVYKWVDANRNKFRRPVWGPIVCEIMPKSQNAAAFIEQHVPMRTLKAFVVECREDYDLLYNEVRGKLNLPVNLFEIQHGRLQPVQRMYSESKMRTLREEHGVTGFMDQGLVAPNPILQALRDASSLHNVLIGNEKTQESIDRRGLLEYLSQPEDGGSGLKGCCICSSHMDRSYKYTSIISRYSGKASTRVDEISQAKMLAPGVSEAQKKALENRIRELQEEMDQIRPQIEQFEARHGELNSKGQEIQARIQEAKHSKADLSKYQQKLNTARRKLREAEDRAASDNVDEKNKFLRQLMARVKSSVTALETHAECHSQMMKATHASAGVRINQDGVAAAERKARVTLSEKQSEFEDLNQQALQINAEFNQAKKSVHDLMGKAEQEAPLQDADGNALPLKAQLEELPVETLEEAEAALEEATAKANSIDANPDVLRQYEQRKVEIAEVREELERVTDAKQAKKSQLSKDLEPWESALKNSVEKVNMLFGKYMTELGCAGEVKLSKGDCSTNRGRASRDGDDQGTGNFKSWGIEILVKFREKSKLQVLSAQVQSGGERSVSTIMYLMALQELMVSPFRCVDEINQGLDERNERLVFKRIVQNSTLAPKNNADPTSHSGQYFLITPKLLPNLYDMENENMTVLFIFNGPYNFKNPLDWNVKNFIQSSKQDEDADENSSSGVNNETRRASGPLSKKRRVSED